MKVSITPKYKLQKTILLIYVVMIALFCFVAEPSLSACNCSGNGSCYDVVDDQTFDAVPWVKLVSGDTVRIHHRVEPYRRIVGLRSIGTVGQPVKICGVRGGNGELPEVSGENGVPVKDYLYSWGTGAGENIGDYGVFLIGRSLTAGDPWQHQAKYIIIEDLKITGAHADNNYFPSGEASRNFVYGAAGVRVTNGTNITIRGCEITGNGNGIFLRGDQNGGDATITKDTLVEGNYIYHNGNSGRETEHNIYSQGVRPIFQYNRIGRLLPGNGGKEPAIGVALKDRSAGAVIRYNWIESGARTLDLVSAEEAYPVVADPDYGKDYVYGNFLINIIDPNDEYASARTITHFGADNMANDSTGECIRYNPTDRYTCRSGPFQREDGGPLYYGKLHFFNNTVVIKDYRTGDNYWTQDMLFEVSTSGGKVDARNNIFSIYRPNGNPRLAMMLRYGTLELNGDNWINSQWEEGHWNYWTGKIVQNFKPTTGATPGFVDVINDDFSLTQGALPIDASSPLAPEALSDGHNLTEMYIKHLTHLPRPMSGKAMDLGAFEYDSGFTLQQNILFRILPAIFTHKND